MKKIALMTWHHAENYGTAYQALAMKSLIEEFGYTVDLIDYRRDDAPILEKKTFLQYLREYNFKSIFFREKKFKFSGNGFDRFYDKYFTYTEQCKYLSDFQILNTVYEAFVCGSDQIWNPNWLDEHYFFDFVEDKSKIIAYAPSCGISDIEIYENEKKWLDLIKDFKYLSLREEINCRQMTIKLNREVFHALDPVLMLDSSFWEKISQKKVGLPEKYAFVFFLKNNKRNFRKAIKKIKTLGLVPIIYHCTQSRDNKYANIGELTPEEMIYVVGHAEYVFTDSFHIMVLSIIFKKQFRIFDKYSSERMKEQNGRLYDVLERLKIDKEWVNVNSNNRLDYKKIDQILNIARDESKRYFEEALRESSKKGLFNEKKSVGCRKHHCESGFDEFMSYYDLKRNRWLLNRMRKWNFILNEDCYECYKLKNDYNIRKPIFYDELKQDVEKKRRLLCIYLDYYAAYDIPILIKEIIKRK